MIWTPEMTGICSIENCGKPVRSLGWCHKHYTRNRKYGNPLRLLTTEPVEFGALLRWIRDNAGHTGSTCLDWPFRRDRNGYGCNIVWNGRQTSAHRIMCMIVNGNPPTPLHHAAHSCGKGHLGCVHPQHLRWATRTENSADMLVHNTRLRGERIGSAKLSTAQVLAIRAADGTLRAIAASYGVANQTIFDIKSGRRWAWL